MNENTRRNIIQFRLNDNELQAFNEVKKAVQADNNADAIRTMIADERLVNITAKQVSKNDRSLAQLLVKTWADLGRSSLSRAVLGLQSNEGLNAINKIHSSYNNIQAQLEGLLWSATNLTNNTNQIAHAANVALQNDPTDADVWNWVINEIQKLLPIADQLREKVSAIKIATKTTGNNNGDS